MSVQSYGKVVPKVNFSISQYYMNEYRSQRPGEFITRDFIDGFITNNLDFFLSQTKYQTYQTKKPFSMTCAQ
jgi:hypothetical protein